MSNETETPAEDIIILAERVKLLFRFCSDLIPNDEKKKEEPVSPLNIEEQEFEDVMKRIVRVPKEQVKSDSKV